MRLNSHIIAMLVEDISDPFFSAVARIIEEQVHRHGYKIFYSSTGNDDTVARDLLSLYKSAAAGAYIIAPPAGIGAEISALVEAGVPVVCFDRYIPGIPVKKVVVDNGQASVLAVRHLWQNNYRRIAFVTLDSAQTQMMQRLDGYIDCMGRLGLQALIHRIPFGVAPAIMTHRIRTFLEEEMPEAVIFATNYLAVSGLRAISALGMTIPDHIAVLGFDDSPYFALCSPSITAIAQPVPAIANAIIGHLMPYLADLPGVTLNLPEKGGPRVSIPTGETLNLPEKGGPRVSIPTDETLNLPEMTILPVSLIARQSTVPHSTIFNRNQILPK